MSLRDQAKAVAELMKLAAMQDEFEVEDRTLTNGNAAVRTLLDMAEAETRKPQTRFWPTLHVPMPDTT